MALLWMYCCHWEGMILASGRRVTTTWTRVAVEVVDDPADRPSGFASAKNSLLRTTRSAPATAGRRPPAGASARSGRTRRPGGTRGDRATAWTAPRNADGGRRSGRPAPRRPPGPHGRRPGARSSPVLGGPMCTRRVPSGRSSDAARRPARGRGGSRRPCASGRSARSGFATYDTHPRVAPRRTPVARSPGRRRMAPRSRGDPASASVRLPTSRRRVAGVTARARPQPATALTIARPAPRSRRIDAAGSAATRDPGGLGGPRAGVPPIPREPGSRRASPLASTIPIAIEAAIAGEIALGSGRPVAGQCCREPP